MEELGKTIALQAYVIYGATHMLFGRPLLEALQAEIDFGSFWRGGLESHFIEEMDRGMKTLIPDS